MQFASTSTPGVPVQTFESSPASSFSGATDTSAVLVPAPDLLTPAPTTAYPYAQSALLAGSVSGIKPGDQVLLLESAWAGGDDNWAWATVLTVAPQPDPNGGVNTCVTFESVSWGPSGATNPSPAASNYRLLRPTQTAALWSLNTNPITGTGTDRTVDLSAVVRAFAPGDVVLFDGPPQDGRFVQGRGWVFANSGKALALVTATTETLLTVPYPGDARPPHGPADFAVPCTELSVTTNDGTVMDGMNPSQKQVAVRYGFRDVGTLIVAPATTLSSLPAKVTVAAGFALPDGQSTAMIEDSTGVGVLVGVTSLGGGQLQLNAIPAMPQTLTPSLIPPLRLLADFVAVSRGTTVPSETLGTGDALGAEPDLHAQAVAADVSGAGRRLREHSAGRGRRDLLAAGRHRLRPAAGCDDLHRHPASRRHERRPLRRRCRRRAAADRQPGRGHVSLRRGRREPALRAADDDPAAAAEPGRCAQSGGGHARRRRRGRPTRSGSNAPASVLSFGRAISADDYETIAAAAPDVSRTRVYWTWDAAGAAHARQGLRRRHPCGGDAGYRRAGRGGGPEPAGRGESGDADRADSVSARSSSLSDRVAADVLAAAQAAVGDPATGLFSPTKMAIGATLYSSQIESALLVDGALAVHGLTVLAGGAPLFGEPVGYASPGEGGFFTLISATITQDTSNG